jgi:ribosomal protein S18 acetylase RimI-like enzyme
MKIVPFRHEDVNAFLALAAEEHWICGRWEFDFLLRHFPEGCLAARLDGAPVAFITSVKYGKSGWIGNLVVRRDLRGKGIGSTLIKKVLETLVDAGARTLWLTASEAGKSIYERFGFGTVDMVKRWFGSGTSGKWFENEDYSLTDILEMDRAGWGDMREPILNEVLERGTVNFCNGGFLISQPAEEGMQLGPWSAALKETAGKLLDGARIRIGEGTRIFLDVPVRNVNAAMLLHSHGFTVGGSALLMFLGERPDYDPTQIYALATMGSIG